MDDLISRQAAIDAITNYAKFLWEKFHETGNLVGMIEAIEGVPSAQQWIPVSERLPKPDEEVFVYLWGNVPHLASVNSEGQWETDQFYLDADDTPKAWMPLPEPYKERKDETAPV